MLGTTGEIRTNTWFIVSDGLLHMDTPELADLQKFIFINIVRTRVLLKGFTESDGWSRQRERERERERESQKNLCCRYVLMMMMTIMMICLKYLICSLWSSLRLTSIVRLFTNHVYMKSVWVQPNQWTTKPLTCHAICGCITVKTAARFRKSPMDQGTWSSNILYTQKSYVTSLPRLEEIHQDRYQNGFFSLL